MTWQPWRDDDDDDRATRARIARALAEANRCRLNALAGLTIRRQADRTLLRQLRRADPDRWAQEQQAALDLLCWRHRRALPDSMRPKLPPNDPIVAEMNRREADSSAAARSDAHV